VFDVIVTKNFRNQMRKILKLYDLCIQLVVEIYMELLDAWIVVKECTIYNA
jgi:hypothetical protein